MGMDILYIVGEFPSRTEYFILNEITALQEKGIRPGIIALSGKADRAPAPGICVWYDVGFFHPKKMAACWALILGKPLTMWRLMRAAGRFSHKPIGKVIKDLGSALYLKKLVNDGAQGAQGAQRVQSVQRVHAHFANRPTDVGFILSRLLASRFSFTAHAHDVFTEPALLQNKIEQADFMITCTAYNKRFIGNITGHRFDHKIFHIYHGLDIGKWPYGGLKARRERAAGAPFTILTVGRLVKKKGIIHLLHAVHQLTEKGYDLRLVIAGDGEEKGSLQRWCVDHHMQRYVYFAGFVPQETVLQYFYEADVFVLPCTIGGNGDRDGLPNVIMEAMAAGVPVIATDVSAIGEVVTDGVTGILVTEKDNVMLAEAISLLIDDEPYRERLRSRARAAVEKGWGIQSSTEQIYALFTSATTA